MDFIPQTFKEKYLVFQGRLNRRRYVVIRILSMIPMFLIIPLLQMHREQSEPGTIDIYVAAMFILLLAGLPFNVSAIVRRWHDLNRSGIWTICNLLFQGIPLLALLLELFLVLKKGTAGSNKYGDDPLQQEE